MRCFRICLFAACAVLIAGDGARAQQNKPRKLPAEAVKQRGLELKKSIEVDLDGDGKMEVVGAAMGPKGIQVVLIGQNDAGAVVIQVVEPAGGKEVAKLEGVQLVPPKDNSEVVVETYDETPDEKVKRVRVYRYVDGLLAEIFTSVVLRAKNASERDAWERDKTIVAYGDARAGWYFADIEEDGITEVLVRRTPKIIEIPSDSQPVKLLTGVREQVWAWDEAAGKYRERSGGPERLNDFLPSLTISKVTASSAWVPPAELKELKGRALSDALAKATDDGKDAKKNAADLKDEIEIDRTPYIQRVADKSLDTAWIEDDKGDGKGQWIEVHLEEASVVKMVRIVNGCVDSGKSFRAHNVADRYKIQLDSGSESVVNRRSPKDFDAPVIAFSDALVKMKDRPWAKTTLVFFDGTKTASRVRITLDNVAKQGKGNLTCIAEVSVH